MEDLPKFDLQQAVDHSALAWVPQQLAKSALETCLELGLVWNRPAEAKL